MGHFGKRLTVAARSCNRGNMAAFDVSDNTTQRSGYHARRREQIARGCRWKQFKEIQHWCAHCVSAPYNTMMQSIHGGVD